MAKTLNELNRRVLVNLHTAQDDLYIEQNLKNSAATGEVIVQIPAASADTALWTLANDGLTAVKFVNKDTVADMILHGPSESVSQLSAATVALSGQTVRIDGELSDLSGVTKNFSGATVAEIQRVDESISAVSGYVVTYVNNVSGDIQTTINALSAGTQAEISTLSGNVHTTINAVSGNIQSTINALSGDVHTTINAVSGNIQSTINALSAGTQAEISALSGNVHSTIDAMDKSASAVAGKVVTTISQENGRVDETKADLVDIALCGYTKTSATGAIANGDSLKVALSKLENVANANAITNSDHSINVTSASTGTDINVNIKSGENVVLLGNDGLYTDIKLEKITDSLPSEVKERYQLTATDGSKLGDFIDVPKDSHIVSINYISDSADTHYQNLEYVYIDASGVTQTTYVDMSSLVLEAEFASGVTVTNHIAHGVVAPNSETFLTVGADGFKLSGVQAAIDAAQGNASAYTDSKIAALDKTDDAAVAGQYVAAIGQTNGVVAVKERLNVSEAVLNNYSKGSDATAVAATDTVNQAIGKLENQIDAAKAAATTKVVEGTDDGNNMSIASGTGADDSVTYTINLSDVASDAALQAVSGAVVALSGTVLDLDATVSGGSQQEHVSISIAQTDGKLSGVVLTTYDIASADALSAVSAATLDEVARAQAAEGEIAGLVGLTGNEGSREWNADGAYLTGSTVKADMELLDDVLGSTTSTTFDSTNTVAKNIDDIKADLAAFKDQLTLSGEENPYAKVTVTSAASGTSIEVSAKTHTIADADSSNADGLAVASDVRSFAVKDVKNAGLYNANNAGVKVDATSGDKLLDFSEIKIDCGTF